MNKKRHEDEEIIIDKNATDNPFRDETETEAETDEITEFEDISSETKDEFQKMKDDFDTLNNQYVRLAADFDNYRKRQAQEKENYINYGKTEALTKLIEVLDNFERAAKTLKESDDIEKVKEGFEVLHKQIVDSLEKMGLTPIETEGEAFDPNFHEAVMQTPSEKYPDQTIINELQKGYKLGEKVIRPALVNVAVEG